MRVEVVNNANRYAALLDGAASAGVAAAAAVYVGSAKRIMQITGPRAGVARGVRGKNTPSDPGEPPAVQTGRLRLSITSSPVRELKSRVGTNVHYGKRLEFGTSRMAPRPWLLPTARSAVNGRRASVVFANTVRANLRKSIGGGA